MTLKKIGFETKNQIRYEPFYLSFVIVESLNQSFEISSRFIILWISKFHDFLRLSQYILFRWQSWTCFINLGLFLEIINSFLWCNSWSKKELCFYSTHPTLEITCSMVKVFNMASNMVSTKGWYKYSFLRNSHELVMFFPLIVS